MSLLLDILSWFLLMVGGGIGLLAGVGLLRLPALFSRMHASGMLATLGAACVLLGLILQAGISVISFKLFLLFMVLSMTSSTAAHALAKAAIASGAKPDLAPMGAAPNSGPKGDEVKS